MKVEEKRKFLSKQKQCYGCYEVISQKHTARNCPRRRNCKICLEKHQTGLPGCKIRRKDEPYAIRTALGWCVFGPIKAECHNAVSCNWIAVVKVDSGKMAEHHFEIEKGCKDIGIKKYMRIKGS